ncbi:MAG: ABC transporter permease subunit [Lachnospiraceae bacterium]|nr:ABC transporter permease subunit [Lachnospiraceae bacterium]
MLNYMKSEWYRIVHTKEIYVVTGALAGLTLLMNLVLFLSNRELENFRYGTVSFSLSFLISGMSVLMIAAAGMAIMLFAGDWRYGILKNAVAEGISREKIFLGKCVIGTIVSICSMVVVLTVYIGSAYLLLDAGSVDGTLPIVVKGVMSTLLVSIASFIFTIVLSSYFEKEYMTLLGWTIVMNLIPSILNLVGRKISILKRIASWMPNVYLKDEVFANMKGWQCLWETPEGFAKCLISGILGIVIFLTIGIVLCRKKDM